MGILDGGNDGAAPPLPPANPGVEKPQEVLIQIAQPETEAGDAHEATLPQPQAVQKNRGIKDELKALAARGILSIPAVQEYAIYNPNDCKPIKNPNEYEELEGLGFTARKLVTERDKKGNATAEILLWERKGAKGKPHYILFSGKSGHIADTGPLPKTVRPDSCKSYDPEHGVALDYYPNVGLKLLRDLAKDDAGVTVVTMRGYGGNKGKPSETNFNHDLEAFLTDREFRARQNPGEVPAAKDTVVCGVSMGTGIGAILTSKMTHRPPLDRKNKNDDINGAPAAFVMVNPYRRFLMAADHTLQNGILKHHHFVGVALDKLGELSDNTPVVRNIKKLGIRGVENIRGVVVQLPHPNLEALLKKNHAFETDERFKEFSRKTQLVIITGHKDEQIPRENSDGLVEVAKSLGLRVKQFVYNFSGHLNMPQAQITENIRWAAEQGRSIDRTEHVVRKVKGTEGEYVTDNGFRLSIPEGASKWVDAARVREKLKPDTPQRGA